jgi:hypothetical protein
MLILVPIIAVAQFQNADAADDFVLQSYPLQDEPFVLVSILPCSAGELPFLCSHSGSMDDDTQLAICKITSNALVIERNLPIPGWPAQNPKLLLADDAILAKDHDDSVERESDPRVGVKLSVINTSDETCEDITPTNLASTTAWSCFGGPPTLWTGEHGLAQFIYEPESGSIVLWQGHAQLTEVQRTPPILACGGTFINGKYTRAGITTEGIVLVYDYESGTLIESNAYAQIGEALIKVLPAPGKLPTQVVLTRNLALFEDKETLTYIAISRDGARLDLPCTSNPEQTLDDFLAAQDLELLSGLDEKGVEKLANDYLLGHEKEAGKTLPPAVIRTASFIIPVDDTRVGIFDKTYQRLITIELAR